MTTFTQLNAEPKIVLWGYILVLSIKDGPVKHAKVCEKKCGHTMIMRTFRTSRQNPIIYRKAQSPKALDRTIAVFWDLCSKSIWYRSQF